MSITDKDRTLMEQVARYFESTAKENANDKKRKYKLKRDDTRSLNDTAAHFGITRAKAMKMLITMDVYATLYALAPAGEWEASFEWDDSVLTDGKVDVAKVAPVCFDPFNNAYCVVKETVGKAWGEGRKLL